jgi:chaperone modulatory protein CbpM
MNQQEFHRVEVVDEAGSISFMQLLARTQLNRVDALQMIEQGVVAPVGANVNDVEAWQFAACDVRRVRIAQRLMSDLDVNLAGAALILELIDERDRLLQQVALMRGLFDE